MTTLADGSVLLTGGAASGGVRLTTAGIHNPDFNVWTPASPMSTGRGAASAVLLDDGSFLVGGGFSNVGRAIDAVERFRPWLRAGKDAEELKSPSHPLTGTPDRKLVVNAKHRTRASFW